MSFPRSRFLAGLAGTGAALAAAGCGVQRPVRGRADVALAYDIGNFDPALATGATPLAIGAHIFEAPFELDPATRVLRPGLAIEAPQRRDSLTYRIGLRAGARFHDGTPLTAQDVVYTLRRLQNPQTNSIFANFLNFIDDAHAIDWRTLELRLKFPSSDLAARLPNLKVVSQQAMDRIGARGYAVHPIGSGPYRFVAARANDAVELERFAGYGGPKRAEIEQLRFHIQIEPSARVAALRTGEVLAAEAMPFLDLSYLQHAPELRARSVPGFGMAWIMFNCAKPPFDDPRVRRAIFHAIDRDAITEIVYRGNARAAASYLSPEHPMFEKPATSLAYDPERARALLKAAGIPQDFAFDLQVSTTSWVLPQATLIEQNLQSVGLQPRVRTGEAGALYRNVTDGSYTAFLSTGDPSVFGYDADTLLRWYFIKTWPDQFYYWHGAQRRELEAAIERAFRSNSFEERRALYGRAQELIARNCPIFPLHHVDLPTAWSRALHGFHPLPTPGLYMAGVAVRA